MWVVTATVTVKNTEQYKVKVMNSHETIRTRKDLLWTRLISLMHWLSHWRTGETIVLKILQTLNFSPKHTLNVFSIHFLKTHHSPKACFYVVLISIIKCACENSDSKCWHLYVQKMNILNTNTREVLRIGPAMSLFAQLLLMARCHCLDLPCKSIQHILIKLPQKIFCWNQIILDTFPPNVSLKSELWEKFCRLGPLVTKMPFLFLFFLEKFLNLTKSQTKHIC